MYQSQPPGHEAQVASYGKHENFTMNRRLEQLYELGVLRVRLQADEEGLPTFFAMPDKPLNLLAPTDYYRGSLSVTLRRLFTAGEPNFDKKTSTAVNSARLQILGDLKAMDEFLAKSATSATAEKLADGESLTRYPQAMARIIRYDGVILGDQGW
ncbi:hypothetical protein F25303_982 [Fusarium sp. NRRL 25303]|nr:hypothetical protein F25303_982 [Fusarium sp. NRRL 25303]